MRPAVDPKQPDTSKDDEQKQLHTAGDNLFSCGSAIGCRRLLRFLYATGSQQVNHFVPAHFQVAGVHRVPPLILYTTQTQCIMSRNLWHCRLPLVGSDVASPYDTLNSFPRMWSPSHVFQNE